jgi:cell division GTPase FtsZ
MTIKRETEIDERFEIIQDVIDRLLYLDADKLEKYKESLNVMHEVFNVNVEIVNGVRKYS